MWLAAHGETARRTLDSEVARPNFAIIDHTERNDLESQLSGDTLGRSVMVAFLVASLAAALLGALALVFVANADRLDEIDVLRALRSSGATAGQLTRLQRTRNFVLIAVSLPVGIVCGLVLLQAVRDSLSVSASGTVPVPPLRTVVAPAMILALGVAMTFLSLLGAELSNRSIRSIGRHDSLAARP
jgi:predicted lysophospholipase L1 biosynthesis ABC-type transport system permease subunit